MHAGGASHARPDQTLKPAGLVLTVGQGLFCLQTKDVYNFGLRSGRYGAHSSTTRSTPIPGPESTEPPPRYVQLPPLIEAI